MILNYFKKTLFVFVLTLYIPIVANADLQSLATIKEGDFSISLYQLRQQYQLRVSNLSSKTMPADSKAFVIDNPTRLVVDIPGVVSSRNTEQPIKSQEIAKLRMGKHSDKIRIVLDVNKGFKIAHEDRVDAKTGDLVVNMGFTKTATSNSSTKNTVTTPTTTKTRAITSTAKILETKPESTKTNITVSTLPIKTIPKSIESKIKKQLDQEKVQVPVITEPVKELKLTESEEEAFSRLKSELSKRSDNPKNQVMKNLPAKPLNESVSPIKVPAKGVATGTAAAAGAIIKNNFGASKITIPNKEAKAEAKPVDKKTTAQPFKIEDNSSVEEVRESLNLPEKKPIAPVIVMKGEKSPEKEADPTNQEKQATVDKKILLDTISYKTSPNTGKASIELGLQGDPKFNLTSSASNPNLFILQLPNGELSNQDLSFPHFAPDNFKDFEVVIPRKTEKGLSLHIYSSKGVTPKALKSGEKLIIEAK